MDHLTKDQRKFINGVASIDPAHADYIGEHLTDEQMMKLLRVTYGICVATGAADGLDFEDWVLQLGASGQVH